MSVPATHLQLSQRLVHAAPPSGVAHGPGSMGTTTWNGFADDLWNYLLSLGGPISSPEDTVEAEPAADAEGSGDASEISRPGQSESAPVAPRSFTGTLDSKASNGNLNPGKLDNSPKKLLQSQIVDPFGSLSALLTIAPPPGLKRTAVEQNGPDPAGREPSDSRSGRGSVRSAGGDRAAANGNSASVAKAQDSQLTANLAFAARLEGFRGTAAAEVETASVHLLPNTGRPAGPSPNPIVSQSGPPDSDQAGNGLMQGKNSFDAAPQDGQDPTQNGSPGRAELPQGSGSQNGDSQQSSSNDRHPENGASQTGNSDGNWRVAISETSRARSENVPHGEEPEQTAPATPEAAPGQEAPTPQKTQGIGLRLETGADSSVAVQLIERGGELHVAVRTHDEDLARSLQNNLGDLVGSLKHQGISADTWTPPASEAQHADTGNPGSRSNDDTLGSGSGSRQRGESGRRGSQERERRPRWVDSLDESFSASVRANSA